MRLSKNNSAYLGTERKILIATAAVMRRKHFLGVRASDVAEEAGLANSSFYGHYKSLSDLVEQNEAKILQGIDRLVELESKRNDAVENLFRRVLLYLFSHREALDLIILTKNAELPIKVVEKLRELITKNWSTYGESINESIFEIYKFECMAEIVIWQSESFSIDTLDEHAHRLSYFTMNTPRLFAQIYYK